MTRRRLTAHGRPQTRRLSRPLPRPLVVPSATTLKTLADVRELFRHLLTERSSLSRCAPDIGFVTGVTFRLNLGEAGAPVPRNRSDRAVSQPRVSGSAHKQRRGWERIMNTSNWDDLRNLTIQTHSGLSWSDIRRQLTDWRQLEGLDDRCLQDIGFRDSLDRPRSVVIGVLITLALAAGSW